MNLAPDEPYDEAKGRIKLKYPLKKGAVLFEADPRDKRIWWLLVWGTMPKPQEMKELLKQASNFAQKWFAIEAGNPKMNKLARLLDFEHIEDNIYAIKTS